MLVRTGITIIGTTLFAWLLSIVIDWVAHRREVRSSSPVWPSLRRRCRLPFRVALIVAAVLIALPHAGVGDRVVSMARHTFAVALIATVTWLIIQLTGVLEDVALARIKVDVEDNRRARRMRTQILVLRRVAIAVLVFIAFAAALMTFPQVRSLGASILVSAGVLSVVAGLAAQSTLSNLLAGLQIALSDSIRLDDVVVVNEEWGRVDEITLTYVVVRTWDNRRLILPVSWFTTNVFQNWTRREARVVGSVVLHLDYSVPLKELRAEMYRVVQDSPLWDGLDWVLQVVDTTPTTMVVRGLVSSADAPTNWDLCCHVRERLLDFVQDRHPEGLPRVRANVVNIGDRSRYEHAG